VQSCGLDGFVYLCVLLLLLLLALPPLLLLLLVVLAMRMLLLLGLVLSHLLAMACCYQLLSVPRSHLPAPYFEISATTRGTRKSPLESRGDKAPKDLQEALEVCIWFSSKGVTSEVI
jgi:hypothetical protein